MLYKWIFWTLLFVAFVAVGLDLRSSVMLAGVDEVWGYDYVTYMSQMRNIDWVTYTGFRHPGLGLILCPIVIIALMMAKISSGVCDVFLVCVMSTVGVCNVWLIKKIAGWFAAILFLTFGFIWVLAAVPESFPFAMTSLLLVIVTVKEEVRRSDIGEKPLPRIVWIALALFAGSVTITNGVKVLIAYLICNWQSVRASRVVVRGRNVSTLTLLSAGVILVALLVGMFFAIRMNHWNAIHPYEQKTIITALVQTLSWIPDGLGFWGRIKGFATNFVTIPFLPRARLGSLVSSEMPSVAGVVWSMGVFVLSLACGVMDRRMKIVQAMAGMFVVDFVIHIVFGWGLDEGWIFCAHWFWMVPILLSLYARSAVLKRIRQTGRMEQ